MKGVVHTSKRLEEELLEASAELAADPALLRPMCAGDCRRCHFDKPFREVAAVASHADDPSALKKFASRGHDIARAYAGTISLAADGTIPLLASGKLGDERISYAVRGSVGADKMIGSQYYRDPKIRLLLYNDMVKRHKLHLYSFDENIVCSNRPNMPEDYLYDTFWETPYEFEDDGLDCGHTSLAVLEIEVKSLGKTVRICSGCARNVSTLQFIISRIASRDPLEDLEVRVIHKLCSDEEDGVVLIEKDQLKKYTLGQLTDRSLMNSVMKDGMASLRDSGGVAYIIGDKNYGSDLTGFLKDLRGSDSDKESLRLFLENYPVPIVLRTDRVSDALSALWEDYSSKIIALSTSEETSDKVGDVSKKVPSDALAEARRIYTMSEVVDSFPEFFRPGPITKLCDMLAKIAKVGGKDLLLESLDRSVAKDRNSRSISAAFLAAVDPEAKYPYTLSKEEKDFMKFLVPFVKLLIDSEPSEYRDNMNTVLTACSSGETV